MVSQAPVGRTICPVTVEDNLFETKFTLEFVTALAIDHPELTANGLANLLYRIAEEPQKDPDQIYDDAFEYTVCRNCGERIRARSGDKTGYRWRHTDARYMRGCLAASRTDSDLGIGNPKLDSDWKAEPPKRR